MDDKYEMPIPLNTKAVPHKDNKVFIFAANKKAEVKPYLDPTRLL